MQRHERERKTRIKLNPTSTSCLSKESYTKYALFDCIEALGSIFIIFDLRIVLETMQSQVVNGESVCKQNPQNFLVRNYLLGYQDEHDREVHEELEDKLVRKHHEQGGL